MSGIVTSMAHDTEAYQTLAADSGETEGSQAAQPRSGATGESLNLDAVSQLEKTDVQMWLDVLTVVLLLAILLELRS